MDQGSMLKSMRDVTFWCRNGKTRELLDVSSRQKTDVFSFKFNLRVFVVMQLTICKHECRKQIDYEIGDKPFSDLMIHIFV